MDGRRFDEWTRIFAHRGTRRRVIGGVLGAVGAGLFGWGRPVQAAKEDEACTKDADCDGLLCCRNPFKPGTICTSTIANDFHCGRCDNACPTGSTCINGTCGPLGQGTPGSGASSNQSDGATPSSDNVDAADLGCCRCGGDPKTNTCQSADSENECIQTCGKGKPYVYDAYSTCEGKVCTPKPDVASGCCTCLNKNRNKGCVNVEKKAACLTYCEAKADADISFQATRICEVSQAGDRYTCHAKPNSNASLCEPLASADALQRQVVGLVDAAVRGADTQREGFVRLSGAITLSLDDVPALSDQARTALSGLGWAGSYTATIGAVSGTAKRLIARSPETGSSILPWPARFTQTGPLVDQSSVNATVSITGHVLSCIPAADSGLIELASLLPGGATPDPKATPAGDESAGFRWEATDDAGQNWQHFATAARTGNVVLIVDSAFTGPAKAGRSINERVLPTIFDRLRNATDDPAQFTANRLASNRLVFPDRTKLLSLMGISYDGMYLPVVTDTAGTKTSKEKRFASVENAILAVDRWEKSSDFYVEIARFQRQDAAVGNIAERRGFYDLLKESGSPVESRPGADGVDWTLHAAVLTQGQTSTGLLASISRVDDLVRESGLIVPNIEPRPDESPFATFERFLKNDYPRFIDYSTRQFACLNSTSDIRLCRLFSSAVSEEIGGGDDDSGDDTGGDEAARATGPAGVVNIAGLVTYPKPTDDIGILSGTYYPLARSLPNIPRSLKDQLGRRDDFIDLKYGRRSASGKVTFVGQSGIGWSPDASAISSYYGAGRDHYRSLAAESFSATGFFASRPFYSGFLPNYQLGPTLPKMDLTIGFAPAGSLIFQAARPGRMPDIVEQDIQQMYDRAMAGEIPGHALGRKIVHLTGREAKSIASRYYTVLDGGVLPIAGESDEQRALRTTRSADQHCVLHQDQDFSTGRTDFTYTSSWDLRYFNTTNAASSWFSGYPRRIEADFGVSLQPITEGAHLAGSHDSTFFFFNRQRDDGTTEGAMLGTARVDQTVAVLRVAVVAQPAAADALDWFFRDGWLPTATGGIALMGREIDLLHTNGDQFEKPSWGLRVPPELRYER